MSEKKTWSDLTPSQQRGIAVGSAVELVLTGIAVRDLVRRPRAAVRGPKLAWAVGMTLQPFGPIGYLLFGRRRQTSAE